MVAGASLVSAPVFPTLFPPPTGQGSGEASLVRPPEPPCRRRFLPPLAVSPSVPVLCAPPSGPWMGKCLAARRPRGATLAPLPFGSCPDVQRQGSWVAGRGTGGPRSGPGRARRRSFRAPPRVARITEGRSAAASPSPTRGPRNIRRPFTPSHREVEEKPMQPPGAGAALRPGPASRHFLSENGARPGGGARGGRPPAWGVAVYR